MCLEAIKLIYPFIHIMLGQDLYLYTIYLNVVVYIHMDSTNYAQIYIFLILQEYFTIYIA